MPGTPTAKKKSCVHGGSGRVLRISCFGSFPREFERKERAGAALEGRVAVKPQRKCDSL